MTDTDDRVTIGERYGVAIGNGSTRIASRGSSGDVVLAAALQRNRVGALLLRLQAEYDMVRGDLERAGAIAPRNVDLARDLERQAVAADAAAASVDPMDPAEAAHCRRRADQLRKEAAAVPQRSKDEIVSARAFILIELKTLRESKARVGALALAMARKPKHRVAAEAAFKLSGRVLDVFLDPICHVCDGTGRVGNVYAGEVEKECRHCRGSGHRRDILGNGATETTFAAVLFGELQRATAAAASGMAKMLGPDQQRQADIDAEAELRRHLDDLRSADAAVD